MTPENTPGLAALDNIRLTSSDGGIVPLTAIASVEQRFTPLSINHLDQFPVTTISFNVPDKYSLGEAVEAILGAEKTLEFPVRYSYPVPGQLRWPSSRRWAAPSGWWSRRWWRCISCSACCMKALSIRSPFSPPCRPAGVGALLALMAGGERAGRYRHHRHHSADRHREEKRHHDDRLCAGRRARAGHGRRARRFTRPVCCVFARS